VGSIELRSERGLSSEDVGLLLRHRVAWCLAPLLLGAVIGAGIAWSRGSESAPSHEVVAGAEAGVSPALTEILDREIAERRSLLASLRTSVVAFEATAGAPDPALFRVELDRALEQLAVLRTRSQQLADELAAADPSAPLGMRGARARLEAERLRTDARMRRLVERVTMLEAALEGVAQRGDARTDWAERIALLEREIADRERARADTVMRWGEERRRIEAGIEAALQPSWLPRFAFGGWIGAVVGAIFGVALMLWRHLRDSRVHTTRQLRAALNVPVLGTISEVVPQDAPSSGRSRRFAAWLACLPRGF